MEFSNIPQAEKAVVIEIVTGPLHNIDKGFSRFILKKHVFAYRRFTTTRANINQEALKIYFHTLVHLPMSKEVWEESDNAMLQVPQSVSPRVNSHLVLISHSRRVRSLSEGHTLPFPRIIRHGVAEEPTLPINERCECLWAFRPLKASKLPAMEIDAHFYTTRRLLNPLGLLNTAHTSS